MNGVFDFLREIFSQFAGQRYGDSDKPYLCDGATLKNSVFSVKPYSDDRCVLMWRGVSSGELHYHGGHIERLVWEVEIAEYLPPAHSHSFDLVEFYPIESSDW